MHFRHFTKAKNSESMGTTPRIDVILVWFWREFDDVTSAGRLFHVRAAATEKARSPTVNSRVDRTTKAEGNNDHSVHEDDFPLWVVTKLLAALNRWENSAAKTHFTYSKTVRTTKWNWNRTVSKQFQNSFKTVSKQFHFVVRTVLLKADYTAWNSLSVDLRSPGISEDLFRKKLKMTFSIPHGLNAAHSAAYAI